ncbi:hypothetical protein CDD81_1589 [Ophiocordyceps australis]|uniref:Uncharacterized protein n=1 Tax=Ophiocordyceps australis TaxID=1399860 RepID=A0A2C5X807_9HYPO|nr:hypothetical protein CDD81_1589 [Ophiocordyceps australis]
MLGVDNEEVDGVDALDNDEADGVEAATWPSASPASLARRRCSVNLFLAPRGRPVRLGELYLHGRRSLKQPLQGMPPLHLILLRWQRSHAERRRVGLGMVSVAVLILDVW